MRYEDSLSAWVVAVSGCLITVMTWGLTRISGLLFVALMEKEGLSRGAASWPFSLPGAAVIFAAPVAGVLSTRYSPARLTFMGVVTFVIGYIPCYFSTNIFVVSTFFGVIRGVGFGLSTAIVPLWTGMSFKRHRATAMGVTVSGQAVGGILFPPLFQLLLLEYGLNGTFLLTAAISAHAFLSCLGYKWYHHKKNPKPKVTPTNTDERTPLLKDADDNTETFGPNPDISTPLQKDADDNSRAFGANSDINYQNGRDHKSDICKSTTTHKSEDSSGKSTVNWHTLRDLFTNRSFYIVCANQTITLFVFQTINQVVIDYFSDKGIPSSLSLYVLTSISVGEIAGKLCLGWIPDRKLLSNENHMTMCMLLSAGMLVLIVNSLSFPVLMIGMFFFGAGQGSALAINFVHFADRMTRNEMTLAVALMRSLNGIVGLSKAPIIGLFRDTLGSYDELFYVFSGSILLLAIIWFVEGCVYSRQTRKNSASA